MDNDKDKEKILGLFDDEDVKYIRFDILEYFKKKSNEKKLVKRRNNKNGEKK